MLDAAVRIGVLVAANVLVGAWVFATATDAVVEDAKRFAPATQRGHALWRAHGCGACHAVFGLGGHTGPDLTNVVRRRGAPYIGAVLEHGVGRMSAQRLNATEREELLAYLTHIDGLAVYPLPDFPADAFGRIGERGAAAHDEGDAP